VEGDRVRVIQGDIFGEHKETQASYPLNRVKLLPPTRPTTFWAVGLNYAAHIAHQEVALDAERIKRESQGFRPWHKGAHCIIGQDDAVVIPADSDYVHYEGELVIVIGKPARKVTPEEAPHFIFGYTIGNDISSEPARRERAVARAAHGAALSRALPGRRPGRHRRGRVPTADPALPRRGDRSSVGIVITISRNPSARVSATSCASRSSPARRYCGWIPAASIIGHHFLISAR
jgi:hypothetical protein